MFKRFFWPPDSSPRRFRLLSEPARLVVVSHIPSMATLTMILLDLQRRTTAVVVTMSLEVSTCPQLRGFLVPLPIDVPPRLLFLPNDYVI